METTERRYLVQCRYNGDWIFMTPAKEEFLRTPRGARRDIEAYREMDSRELEYRLAEMRTTPEGDLVPVAYHEPETFR